MIKYCIELKAREDFTCESDFFNNTYCEEKNGYKYGVWFDSLEEAKKVCKQLKAYAIISDEWGEKVWENEEYESESFERLREKLGEILLKTR